MSLADFLEAIEDELGEAATLVRDEQFIRWINRGRARLGLSKQTFATITWADGEAFVWYPTDCQRVDGITPNPGSRIPAHYQLLDRLTFLEPAQVRAGSATLYYGASYPEITGSAASTLPELADEAIVSFVLARYFKRIASIRSDFRRYVAITGQNGVDVRDLLDLALDHERDFEATRLDLVTDSPATFYWTRSWRSRRTIQTATRLDSAPLAVSLA